MIQHKVPVNYKYFGNMSPKTILENSDFKEIAPRLYKMGYKHQSILYISLLTGDSVGVYLAHLKSHKSPDHYKVITPYGCNTIKEAFQWASLIFNEQGYLRDEMEMESEMGDKDAEYLSFTRCTRIKSIEAELIASIEQWFK